MRRQESKCIRTKFCTHGIEHFKDLRWTASENNFRNYNQRSVSSPVTSTSTCTLLLPKHEQPERHKPGCFRVAHQGSLKNFVRKLSGVVQVARSSHCTGYGCLDVPQLRTVRRKHHSKLLVDVVHGALQRRSHMSSHDGSTSGQVISHVWLPLQSVLIM